jgi:AcrR family transcriptional regulator
MVVVSTRGSQPDRLDRAAWTEAALEALARGGVPDVAVEPIAARLGATKGSFYHHFRTRQELLQAALELWESRHTLQVNAMVGQVADTPREQLAVLARTAVRMAEDDPIGFRLLPSAADPLVAPVVTRVTRQRLDFLTELYRRTGHGEHRARQLAQLTYSLFLGHMQLVYATPEVLPQSPDARRDYLELVLDTLATPTTARAAVTSP